MGSRFRRFHFLWTRTASGAIWGLAVVLMLGIIPRFASGADAPPIAVTEVKAAAPLDFGKDIEPILRANCIACHNQKASKGDLVLETPQTIIRGGENGPAATAGKGAESLLLKAASHRWDSVMPPKNNKVGAEDLTPLELGTIKLWIDEGLKGTSVGHAGPTDWQPLPPGLNPIYSVALSDDGQYAVCSRANQIFVYHVPSRGLVTRLTDPALSSINGAGRPGIAHRDMVESLAFSPDGRLLASGSYREVKLWRRPEPSVRATITDVGTKSVTAVAASPKGNVLAVAGNDNLIRLCDSASGKSVQVLKGHGAPVTAMQFTADGSQLYSASADKSVRVWNTTDGKEIGRIDTPAPLRDIALINQDSQFISAADEESIRIWSTLSAAKPLDGISGTVSAIATSADKKRAPIATTDGKITLFDLPLARPGKTFTAHAGAIQSLGFTADGSRLLTAGDDKRLIIWDVAKASATATLELDGAPLAAAIRPDGKQAVTSWGDGNVILWDLATPPSRDVGEANDAPVTRATVSANGQAIAYAGVVKGSPVVLVRELSTGKLLQTLSGHAGAITAVAFSPDGTRIVTGSADKTARVWTTADGKEVARFTGHVDAITAVVFPSAAIAVSAAGSNVKTWTTVDGKIAKDVAAPANVVSSMAILSGGANVVIASADLTLKVVDSNTGDAVRSIPLTGGAATTISVSKDGALIAVGSSDKKIRVLKAADGAVSTTIDAAGNIASLCFNADGTRLMSVGADQKAVIWNVADGARLETLPVAGATFGVFAGALPNDALAAGADRVIRAIPSRVQKRIPGLTKPVSLLAYGSSGEVIYTGGTEGVVRAFSTDNTTQRFQAVQGAAIVDLKLSGADGGWLATLGEDKTVKLWDARSGNPSTAALTIPSGAAPRSVGFSADNKRLLVADDSGGISMFAVEPVQGLKGSFISAFHDLPPGGITSIVCVAADVEKFPAGGDVVLAACADKTLRMWRPALQRAIIVGGTGATAIRPVPTSPTQFLVGVGNQITQYDGKNASTVRSYNLPAPVSGIAISADAKKVAAVGGNLGRVWDAVNGQELASLIGDRSAVEAAQTQERWVQYADSEIQFWKNQITELKERQTAEGGSIGRATTAQAVAMAELPGKEKAFGEKTALKNAAEKKLVDAKAAFAKAGVDRDAAETDMLATAKVSKELDEKLPGIQKASQTAQEEAAVSMQKLNSLKSAAEQTAADAKQKSQTALAAKTTADAKPADADLAKAAAVAQKSADDAAAKVKAALEDVAAGAMVAETAVAKAKVTADAYTEAQKTTTAAGQKAQAAAGARNQAANLLDQRMNESRQATDQLRDAKSENARAQAASEQAQLAVNSSAKALKASQDSLEKAKKDSVAAAASQATAEAASLKAKADLETARKSSIDAQKKIAAVAFSRDGGLVVTGGEDGAVRTWSSTSGAFADTLRSHTAAVTCLALAGDGAILSGSADRTAKIWDTNAGWALIEKIGTGDAKSILADRVMALAFTPDSTRLAIGGGVPSRSGELKLWGLAKKTVEKEFVDAHSDTVYSLSFSGDGRYLASGSADKFVKVWNVPSDGVQSNSVAAVPYTLVRAFEGHTHHVLGVSFRFDGRTVMSAGADSVVKSWDMVTGEQRGATTPEALGKMEATSIHFIGFTETALLTTGQGVIRVLRDSDVQAVRNFDGLNTFLYCGATTPDGMVFAVGGDDSVLRLRDGRDGRVLTDFRSPDEAVPVEKAASNATRAAVK